MKFLFSKLSLCREDLVLTDFFVKFTNSMKYAYKRDTILKLKILQFLFEKQPNKFSLISVFSRITLLLEETTVFVDSAMLTVIHIKTGNA